MTTISRTVQSKLHTILIKDYEECQFFFAASNILKDKIKQISALMEKDEIEFAELRDAIGGLGIYIGNIEKGLNEVEDCYTRLVDALER